MSALRAIAPAFAPPRAVNDNGPLRAATDNKPWRTAAIAPDTSFDRNVIPFRRSKASLRSAQPLRAYDGLGQLLTNTGFWGPNNDLITASATYDSLGNIRSKGFGNRVVSLAYDTDNGNVNGKNRVVQSIDSQPAPIAGAPKISGEGAGGTGTRTVAYDNRGNVTSLGTMAFYYDYSDQPTVLSGTKTDGTSLTGNYRYDGHLKRVRNQVNGKTIYNVFDASGKLVHTRDITQDRTADYIIANGETVARWGKDHWIFDHQDHLGSTVAATHMNGNVNARIRYAPFGLMMDDPKKLRDGAGYTGHLKDSDTGLNYMQARYYDPIIGRFLSTDPVGFVSSGQDPRYFNRYVYTWNDPINGIDPNGEDVIVVTGDADAQIGAGKGVSTGVYTQFEYRLPSVGSIIDGLMDNPGNIIGAAIDSVTDVTEVGIAVSVKTAVGLDTSIGMEVTYGLDNANDLAGISIAAEAGAGPFSVGTAIPLIDGEGTESPSGPRSFTGEVAFSPPSPSGSVGLEATAMIPLRTQERSDFD